MRAFTDGEKQQLQSKIEDEQERQRVLRESIQIEKEKQSKRGKGIISTAFSYKYGMLVVIFFLIVLSIHLLLPLRNNDPDDYSGLILGLALLFNHLAYQLTKKGRFNRVMKTIAWTWIAFVWAYIILIFWIKVA